MRIKQLFSYVESITSYSHRTKIFNIIKAIHHVTHTGDVIRNIIYYKINADAPNLVRQTS